MKKVIAVLLVLVLLSGIMPAAAAAGAREVESNDSSHSATAVGLNSKVIGNFSGSNDLDYYSFELTQPGVVQLCIQHKAGGAYNVTLYRTEAGGDLGWLQGWDFDYAGAAGLDTTQYADQVRLPEGIYYIAVVPMKTAMFGEPYKVITDDYSITIAFTPEQGEENEKEFNDTPDSANRVAAGKAVTGNLNDPSDKDYYRFSLPEPGTVQLKFQFRVGGNYEAVLRRYGEDGAFDWGSLSKFKYLSNTESGSVTQYSEALRLPRGDYYVCIQKGYYYDPIYDDYELTLQYTSEPGAGFEKEFNNSAQAANLIDINTSVVGNLSADNTRDYFYFVLPKAGSAQIEFRFVKGPYSVCLYELPQSGGEIKYADVVFKDTGSASTVQYTDSLSLPAGVYYISISSYNMSHVNSDYTLTLLSDAASSVTPSTWAQQEVAKAIEAGLVPEGLQCDYTHSITRLEFCALSMQFISVKSGTSVVNFLNRSGKSIDASVFTDTTDFNVQAAYALGIVNGRGNGIFDPGGLINRQEAAKMLMNTAAALGYPTAGRASAFADSGSVAAWAENAVGYVSSLQDPTSGKYVMGGMGNNMFSPLTEYSREMSILTFVRLYGALSS